MFQTIHGNRIEMIPTGGRMIRDRDDASSSLKEVLVVESKKNDQGTRLHIYAAKGQHNRRWSNVSCPPQRRHEASVVMSLRWRLSLVGSIFLAHFQRKCLIFGRSGGDQMFFSQFQVSLIIRSLVEWIFERIEE